MVNVNPRSQEHRVQGNICMKHAFPGDHGNKVVNESSAFDAFDGIPFGIFNNKRKIRNRFVKQILISFISQFHC